MGRLNEPDSQHGLTSQPYECTINGVLYGTDCQCPVLIPIPMDLHLSDPWHVDDLTTSVWIKGVDDEENARVRPLTKQRQLVQTFPGVLDCDLVSPFYVYTTSQIRNRSTE